MVGDCCAPGRRSGCCGQPGIPAKKQSGLTFLTVLFAIAIAGIALAGTGTLWQMEDRREKEKQLLFVGEQYRQAIASYYQQSPGDARYPSTLADLLLDKRFPMPVRHLRQRYPDPMTGSGEWTLIRRQGGIIGVASQSAKQPVKVADFSPQQADFEGANSYANWQFIDKGMNNTRRRISDRDGSNPQ